MTKMFLFDGREELVSGDCIISHPACDYVPCDLKQTRLFDVLAHIDNAPAHDIQDIGAKSVFGGRRASHGPDKLSRGSHGAGAEHWRGDKDGTFLAEALGAPCTGLGVNSRGINPDLAFQ